MEERKHLLDYLAQVFMIFGITLFMITIIGAAVGEEAKEVSTMFRLGSRGIPTETVFQYFLTSICITALRFFFFTDVLVKKMSVAGRTVSMLAAVIFLIGAFSCIFGWFPVREPEGWIAFLFSFGVCFVVSASVSVRKEKAENRRLESGLRNLKETQKNGERNEGKTR